MENDKSNPKKARMAKLISGKVDFGIMNISRDKEDHFIMLKGLIHQEDITILYICSPRYTASKYMKGKLIEL